VRHVVIVMSDMCREHELRRFVDPGASARLVAAQYFVYVF